ncbi:hypothetical protein BDBG_17060 [Blastomyces gilchristii SLH14081]|uniref:Uncharacterized protein n=1 Tax=Blastomyces gilchristii (strain SLH14081) TaxID=559298 RepID=A0A179UKM5_BLAGS|nr:uncharacterized protein BDBG_17060 [Blastomyces gilchristii SLH14081]OAT08524.1 hypothetical protein BDBG_17060 [Blastomyces gilchristii SLH14081]
MKESQSGRKIRSGGYSSGAVFPPTLAVGWPCFKAQNTLCWAAPPPSPWQHVSHAKQAETYCPPATDIYHERRRNADKSEGPVQLTNMYDDEFKDIHQLLP